MKNSCLLILVWLGLIGFALAQQLTPASIRKPLGIQAEPEQVELGRDLFFFKGLSSNREKSCADCHNPARAFTDGVPVAVGSFGRLGTENSPSLLNVARSVDGRAPLMFHDGRTRSLASQSLLPLANRNEMGNQTEQDVINRLRNNQYFVTKFERAYGPRTINNQRVSPVDRNRFGHAMESFQASLMTDLNAPIHKRLAGDTNALSPSAEIGYGLFVQHDCMSCHPAPYFTDLLFHNNGMEWVTRATNERLDGGRADIVGNGPNNRNVRAFKTGPLIEVQLTAPYGHNGRMTNLERVARHYATGGLAADGTKDPNLDPRVRNMRMTGEQEKYLIEFLRTGFISPTYDPPRM